MIRIDEGLNWPAGRLLLALAVLAGAGTSLAQKPDNDSGDLIAEPNIDVRVRDNITLSLDIYRPAGAGRYPTLYAAGPFPQHSDGTPPASPLTGPVAWYVQQGYAVVLASTRGTGLSQGSYGFLSRDEQQDHYELIEWIAQQSWSDQTVAGYGAGYYATSQWLMAIQSPPHLECIAPYNGVLDPYRDWAYPGGRADSGFALQWYDREIRQANAYPASGPGRLVEYDLRLQQLQHPLYDEYWRLRSARENLDQIRVPVFALRSWDHDEPGALTTLRSLSQLNSPYKMLLTDDESAQLYSSEQFHEQEILPYYEWCLRDQGREYIERPRVRYQVKGQGQIKRDSSWPPGNIGFTPLYLNSPADGAVLGLEPIDDGNSTSAFGTADAPTALVFMSDTLENDIELSGPIMLELYVSSSSNDTAFTAHLSEEVVSRQVSAVSNALPSFLKPEVDPASNLLTATTDVPVSRGALKASLRALDPELSTEYQPHYSFSAREPLSAGRVYKLDLALQPVAYRFRRGNRIKLTVHRSPDASLLNLAGQDRLHHGGQYASRLWVPMVQSVLNQGSDSRRSTPAPDQLPANAPGIDAESLFDSDSPIILLP